MNSPKQTKPISWLRLVFLLVATGGLLATVSIPNFVGGGPSRIFHIKGILMNIDRMKYEWVVEHGYTNNLPPLRQITLQDIAPFFYRLAGEDPFARIGLVIDKDGNLRNVEGVVFVINDLGVSPEARFTKTFKLNRIGGFSAQKSPKARS